MRAPASRGVLWALVLALASCSSDGGGEAGSALGVSRVAPGERPAGTVATARPGDWQLASSEMRAVVQELTPSPWILDGVGGYLVDLERVRDGGRGPDILKLALPTVQFQLQRASSLERIEGEAGAPARLRATGTTEPFGLLPDILPVGRDVDVALATEHWIAPGGRHLTVETRVENRGRSLGDNAWLMDLVIFAGEAEPFGPGRDGEISDVEIDLAFLAARTPEAAVALVPERFGFTLAGSVSGVRLLVYSTDPLPAGGTAAYRRHWIAGRDLADVLEEVYAIRGIATGALSGTVRAAGGGAAPGARVEILDDGSGALVSEAYAGARGAWSARLPPGRYRVEASDAGSRVGDDAPVEITVGGAVVRDLALPAAGTLRVQVRDAAGRALPAELLLDGPVAERRSLHDGRLERRLPPGRYSLTAMRGPEYTLGTATVEVGAGSTTEVELDLERVVDTSGWIASDLHLHSARSPDASIPVEDRVAAVVASGLEWVPATDHDVLTDYLPVIERLGLGAWLAATPGQEISSTTYGHFNAFPLRTDDTRAANGAVSWYFQAPAQVFERVRAASPGGVLQVNHPRMDRLGGYFEAIAFDPELGIATRSPEEVGLPPGSPLPVDAFDAVEVFNDKTDESNEAAFRDYTGLLDLGLTVTMTGNSDSHVAGRIPGFPRTYIASSSDDPAGLDEAELIESLGSARAMVSGGLVLDVTVEGAGPGSLVTVPPGEVALAVRLQAAPWVDARRVEVLVNGERAAERAVEASTEVVRLDAVLPLVVERDAWIVVRASGDEPMLPWKARAPFAASNPIWLDVDGDGRFDPRAR